MADRKKKKKRKKMADRPRSRECYFCKSSGKIIPELAWHLFFESTLISATVFKVAHLWK